MKFLNKRTGAVISVPCRLEGPDWKEIVEAKEQAKPVEKPAETPVKTAPKRKTVKKG